MRLAYPDSGGNHLPGGEEESLDYRKYVLSLPVDALRQIYGDPAELEPRFLEYVRKF